MRKNGFSLLEIMIVLAIMMIAALSIPAFHTHFDRQGVGMAARQLRGDLQLARIMAIKQRRTCTIVLNRPGRDQYTNSINHQRVNLSGYRGGVGFLAEGPDGGRCGGGVSFNRRGMSTSAVPVNIYLAGRNGSIVYRLRVLGPGGISVMRWNGSEWQ